MPARAEAMRAIARRLAGHEPELAREVVARCRQQILDYRAGDDTLASDATEVAQDNLEALLADLDRAEPASSVRMERTRIGAARRFHQGVSLESFLQAVRVWGQVAWEGLRGAVGGDSLEEHDAALEIATRVMQHVDVVSTVGTLAYLHEAQGASGYKQVLRRDLLEALLGGERDVTLARRRAQALAVRLADHYAVVVVRPQEILTRGDDGQPAATATPMREAVDLARTHLRPRGGALLVGVREPEVICLYPVAEPAHLHAVKQDAVSLARAIASRNLTVGMSGWEPGLAGIGFSYGVAKEAAKIAAERGIVGRVVSLDEVLVDHIARYTPQVRRVLDDALRPLIAYDMMHGTALVQTVAAYIDAAFNLTRSAEVLHVHPNTVMYRLRRVRELCGRDPQDPDDLLILFLSLKLLDLNPSS